MDFTELFIFSAGLIIRVSTQSSFLLKIFFYVYGESVHTYVCVLHACLVPRRLGDHFIFLYN